MLWLNGYFMSFQLQTKCMNCYTVSRLFFMTVGKKQDKTCSIILQTVVEAVAVGWLYQLFLVSHWPSITIVPQYAVYLNRTRSYTDAAVGKALPPPPFSESKMAPKQSGVLHCTPACSAPGHQRKAKMYPIRCNKLCDRSWERSWVNWLPC